jgi:hypothetical protein
MRVENFPSLLSFFQIVSTAHCGLEKTFISRQEADTSGFFCIKYILIFKEKRLNTSGLACFTVSKEIAQQSQMSLKRITVGSRVIIKKYEFALVCVIKLAQSVYVFCVKAFIIRVKEFSDFIMQ